MNSVTMDVNTPKEFLTALSLARNAFLSKVSINLNNHNRTFSKEICKDITDGINAIFSSKVGFFSSSQGRSYSSCMSYYPDGSSASVEINAKYMSDEKERNDFTCIAAEIGELLNKKCKNNATELEKITEFAKWVRKNFVYKNNGVYQDHSAAELLKNRSGVCQAIAALASVVLPYMGLKTQYVVGDGKGAYGWGPHAWNMVLIEGRWVHVDFTFGLNRIKIPMTYSDADIRRFLSKHKWDENTYSNGATEAKYRINKSLFDAEVILYLNQDYFIIDEVKIHTEKPVYYMRENVAYIRYNEVLKYLAGGIELNQETNDIYICVSGKRHLLKNATDFLDSELCGIRVDSLDEIRLRHAEIAEKMMIKF